LSAATTEVAGATLVADLSGALVWPAEKTVIVADLHFEKGSSFARGGALLPPYDSRDTLLALADVLQRYRPQRVICLGDSFHDGEAADRLGAPEAESLSALTGALEWIWIAGNHDPAPPAGLGGRVVETLDIGPLHFRHEAAPLPVVGEVSGHFHPVASVATRGRRLRGRCFVNDSRRIMLPAFGSYTGGLNVTDPAIAGLFDRHFLVHLVGHRRVHTLPGHGLRRARLS
jgi:DNA ligase-associated metallophosphoesterase